MKFAHECENASIYIEEMDNLQILLGISRSVAINIYSIGTVSLFHLRFCRRVLGMSVHCFKVIQRASLGKIIQKVILHLLCLCVISPSKYLWLRHPCCKYYTQQHQGAKDDEHAWQEMPFTRLSTDVCQRIKGKCSNDGAQLAWCGRYSVSFGPMSCWENLCRENKRCCIRSKVEEELTKKSIISHNKHQDFPYHCSSK